MREKKRYEAVVIGSGQGGVPLAMTLAHKGLKTALIESRFIGGTCVNYGCTPTKTMVASARVAHIVQKAADYGVTIEGMKVDLQKVRERKRSIVNMFRSSNEKSLASAENLDLIRGTARFVDAHTLEITDSETTVSIEAEKIFINTGTSPRIPRLQGIEDIPFLDNETVMELAKLPRHLIVLGGGYVGLEFGQMFRRFGSSVTIVQRGPQLLVREDEDVSEEIRSLFVSEGIEVLLKANVQSISRDEKGDIALRVAVGERIQTISGSHLLVATGRVKSTKELNPQGAGIQTDDHGAIIVNDRLETSVDNVWALGDVKGGPAFTHISYDDYRIISRNLFGDGKGSTVGRIVPYTVFIDPQLGRVGMTEREALASGRKIRIASLPMKRVARALETDETRGLMKAEIDADTGEILGFAMFGIQGGEVAGAVQIAMMGQLPYSALRDSAFAHPTLVEALNNLFSSFRE